MHLHLVPCGIYQNKGPIQAQNLYYSQRFIDAKNHCTTKGLLWRIISTKHNLLDPTTVIANYNTPIPITGTQNYANWLSTIISQLGTIISTSDNITVVNSTPSFAPLFADIKLIYSNLALISV